MNKNNLLLMAEYIETIPQDVFDMGTYRKDGNDRKNHACNSVGCIIGHCTILDSENNLNRTAYMNGIIDFVGWSEKFTGLKSHSNEWDFLFSGIWDISDNTPVGASKRIKYFVEHGLPKNWEDMMYGQASLCYNE